MGTVLECLSPGSVRGTDYATMDCSGTPTEVTVVDSGKCTPDGEGYYYMYTWTGSMCDAEEGESDGEALCYKEWWESESCEGEVDMISVYDFSESECISSESIYGD